MKTKSKIKFLGLSAIVVGVAFCMASFVTATDWPVPAANAAVKNPVAKSSASTSAGLATYTAKCKMCHGVDGAKVPEGNLKSPTFKKQTDGAIFYKITTGKGKMPAFKSKLAADKDRWDLVNYLRTL